MPGRCLRRPFGQDYATITNEELLTPWQHQTNFFEFVAETPPFDVVARTLLSQVREQWRLWRACGDAKKKADPRKVIADHQHEVEEVERWIDQGCPASAGSAHQLLVGNNDLSRWIDAGCPPRQQQRTIVVAPENAGVLARWIDAVGQDETIHFPGISSQTLITALEPASIMEKVIYSHSQTPDSAAPQGEFDLASLRNGNWVKGLREIAINGLPTPKSLHIVCYELAKWLYWVELYKQPDCEKVIYRLLSTFVAEKHNGHCQRIIDANMTSVDQDLKNAIKSAMKLDPAYRNESLEIFTKLRQKRSQGQYKHIINLAPLLEGDIVAPSSSSSGLLVCVSSLESELPKEVQDQIIKKAGRNKVMIFATRLINLLHQHRGSCRLHQDKLMELLGYKNKNQATKYINILIAAKVVKKGAYRQGKASRLYTLTKDVLTLLNDASVNKEVVA